MDSMQILISVLVGVSVIAIGGAILMGRRVKRAPLEERLRQIAGGQMTGDSAAVIAPKFTGIVENIGTAVAHGKASVTLREQLTQAGYHSENAASVHVGAKLMLAVVGLLGAAALVVPSAALQIQTKSVVIMLFSMGFFFIPNIIVSSRRASR